MKEYKVIGFTYKEKMEMENELNVEIYTDMGVVGLSLKKDDEEYEECEKEYEEREKKLLNYIQNKYDIKFSENVLLFSNDTDQNFPFYFGIMVRE